MGASVKYLQRDDGSGRLTYRRAFPASLRPNVPGNHSELKRTLGCTDIGDPKCAARYSDACKEYDQLLAFAQKAKAEAFDVPDDPNTA